MISSLATQIVQVTDTAFLAHLGEQELGGAGNATLLYLTLFLIGMGFTTGIQIIIGRRNGEKNFGEIGIVWQHGLRFLLLFETLLFVLLWLGREPLLSYFISSSNILIPASDYLGARSWGIFFTLTNLLFVAFFVGTTNTKILAFFTPIVSIFNILLDYVLIFGEWGFPELGVSGAAIASNLSEFLGLLFFIVYFIIKVDLKKYGFDIWHKFESIRIQRVLKLSTPLMLQNLISLGAWFVFFSIIEGLGERELAISHVVRSLYIFCLVPVFALGSSTNTLVSNLIGRNESEKVLGLIWKATGIGLLFSLIPFLGIQFGADWILEAFTGEEVLAQASKPTLLLVSYAVFTFAAGLVVFKGLSGTGNTSIALWLEVICVFIYLLASKALANIPDVSIEVVWYSEFIYFFLLFILSWLFMYKGRWLNKQV